METLILTNKECEAAAEKMVMQIRGYDRPIGVYGIPRGGIPVAYLVGKFMRTFTVDDPHDADIFVDDICASGRTRDRFLARFPKTPLFALKDFIEAKVKEGQWISFPWERENGRDASADDIVLRLLQFIGEDPTREGLVDTPKRVMSAWREWTNGYGQDPQEILKSFNDGADGCDQMVAVKDIPFYSHCEHHLVSFFGTATIAYIPDKQIVGLSKLGRIVDVFANRLQVQERMTNQIANAIDEHLKPKGVGVLLKARHLCIESRGLSKQGHVTITSALRGEILSDAKVRSEFLSLAQ